MSVGDKCNFLIDSTVKIIRGIVRIAGGDGTIMDVVEDDGKNCAAVTVCNVDEFPGGDDDDKAPCEWGNNICWEEMNASTGGVARNTYITSSSWKNIYNVTGAGALLGFLVTVERGDVKWDKMKMRIIIDGVDVFFGSGGLKFKDFRREDIFAFGCNEGSGGGGTTDTTGTTGYQNPGGIAGDAISPFHMGLQKTCNTLRFQGPLGCSLTYNSSIKIQLRTTSGSVKFKAGAALRTK